MRRPAPVAPYGGPAALFNRRREVHSRLTPFRRADQPPGGAAIIDDQRPAPECLLRSRHSARAAPPTVAARTRIVSAAGIRLDHRKSVRPFKGILPRHF